MSLLATGNDVSPQHKNETCGRNYNCFLPRLPHQHHQTSIPAGTILVAHCHMFDKSEQPVHHAHARDTVNPPANW